MSLASVFTFLACFIANLVTCNFIEAAAFRQESIDMLCTVHCWKIGRVNPVIWSVCSICPFVTPPWCFPCLAFPALTLIFDAERCRRSCFCWSYPPITSWQFTFGNFPFSPDSNSSEFLLLPLVFPIFSCTLLTCFVGHLLFHGFRTLWLLSMLIHPCFSPQHGDHILAMAKTRGTPCKLHCYDNVPMPASLVSLKTHWWRPRQSVRQVHLLVWGRGSLSDDMDVMEFSFSKILPHPLQSFQLPLTCSNFMRLNKFWNRVFCRHWLPHYLFIFHSAPFVPVQVWLSWTLVSSLHVYQWYLFSRSSLLDLSFFCGLLSGWSLQTVIQLCIHIVCMSLIFSAAQCTPFCSFPVWVWTGHTGAPWFHIPVLARFCPILVNIGDQALVLGTHLFLLIWRPYSGLAISVPSRVYF